MLPRPVVDEGHDILRELSLKLCSWSSSIQCTLYQFINVNGMMFARSKLVKS